MSYEPGDEYLEGVISGCCSARVIMGDLCAKCKDHCGTEPEELDGENKHNEFSPEQEAIIERTMKELELEELEKGGSTLTEL